jgi:hypothetical protein
MNAVINYDEFIDSELKKNNLKIVSITEDLVAKRLAEIKSFVNGVKKEFSNKYCWTDESDEYFLKPMDRKFLYSFMIINEQDEIVNLTFNSIYRDRMHIHCMYTRSDFRKMGLTKLAVIKVCQKGIDCGFETIGGFWPKKNSGSIILFLKLGWMIEHIRNEIEIFMMGKLNEIRENAANLYQKENHF